MKIKARLIKLENQIKQGMLAIIYYREGYSTLEQAKEKYKKGNGFELPKNVMVICYRRIDTTNVRAH